MLELRGRFDGTCKPSCLFRLLSRLPWWEGSGHSYLWPYSEKQMHSGGPASPPCSLGPWPPAPGYMSSEHRVFCKEQALLGRTGLAGPRTGGGSHVQAALIPQRADLRGPQDGTAPKPCLLQRHSSSRGGSDSGAARGTQSHDTAVAEPSGGAGGTVEARGVRAKLGSGPRGGVIHPPPRRELAVSGLGLQGQPV